MLSAIWALALKDLRLFARDRVSVMMTFLFPIIVAVFFGSVFSSGEGSSKLEIAIADDDSTPGSKAFVALLAESDDVKLSARPTADAARKAVLDRNALAFIHISKGFEAEQADLFAKGQGPEIEMGIDPSRQAEGGWIQGIVQQAAFRSMSQSFSDPKLMKKQLDTARAAISADKDTPIATRLLLDQLFNSFDGMSASVSKLNESTKDTKATNTSTDNAGAKPEAKSSSSGFAFQPIRVKAVDVSKKSDTDLPASQYAITFPQGMIWGIMGCAMGFAGTLAGERTRGTLMRLQASPLPSWAVLLSKGLATAIVTMLVMWLLITMAVLVFKVQVNDWLKLVAATLSVAAAFMGIMMFAATLGKSEAAVNRVGWFIMMGLAFLGGAAVPAFLFGPTLTTLGSISPVKWSLQAMDGAIWRGWDWPQMLTPLGILLAIGVVGIMLGLGTVRMQRNA